jgi:hypothetical protein
MRPISMILLASALAACPPTADDDDSCAASGLVVCATMGGEPDLNAEALIRTGPEDGDPISTPVDADGCARFEPGPGDYEVQARDIGANCISEWTASTAPLCGDETVTLDLLMGCLDGRGP